MLRVPNHGDVLNTVHFSEELPVRVMQSVQGAAVIMTLTVCLKHQPTLEVLHSTSGQRAAAVQVAGARRRS